MARIALLLLAAPVAFAGMPAWPELPGCPLDDELHIPAGFEYVPSGRTREATGLVALPTPFEELARLVDDVERYPEWVLLDRWGDPVLHDMQFDPVTGRGAISVSDSEDGRIEGMLQRRRHDGFLGLELEMLAGDRIKEARLEIGVAPYERCEDSSLLFIRATWKVGLLAHIVADKTTLAIPAFLVLALRDDVAAKVLAANPGAVESMWQRIPSPDLIMPPGTEAPEGAEISMLHFEPAAVRADERPTGRLRKILGQAAQSREPKESKLVPAFFGALSGTHRIEAYRIVFGIEGMERPGILTVGTAPEQLGYHVEVAQGHFAFSFGLTGLPP